MSWTPTGPAPAHEYTLAFRGSLAILSRVQTGRAVTWVLRFAGETIDLGRRGSFGAADAALLG